MERIRKFIKYNKRLVIIVACAIVLIVTMVILVSALNKHNDEGTAETVGVQTEKEPAPAEEVIPATNIVAVSETGPYFPQLDLGTVPTEAPAPEFITIGTKHSIVAKIQQRLMDLGFMDNDEPTEYYGEGTMASVKKFQRQNDLDQDGVVGPDTLAMIFAEDAGYYAAREGDDGDDIISIQERLYQLGYLADKALVTGHFGEKTKEGVIKLQEINGITVDGTVGRQTYNLIYSDEVKANFLTFGEKSDVVLKAQQRLLQLGYMTSTPDGTYGYDTMDAIKTFQRKNALVVDGYLGPSTRDMLFSSGALANHLGIGDQNDQVTRVQQRLIKYGYLSSSRATGYFGEITQKAVKNFQKQNKLSADGMVGAKTLAKLTGDDAKKAASGMIDGRNFNTTTASTASGGGTGGSSGGSAGGSGADAGSTTQAVGGSSVPNTDANGVSGSVSNLLNVARSKLGAPYVWGSKGPNSFDCSGFVNWVLNQCGVGQSYITSAGWRNVGNYQRISNYSDLRAGDVIVVNGHVGFISTNGNLIDASSSNGRVIERSLGSWWQNHFIVGWRIF